MGNLGSKFTLGNSLFGVAELTKIPTLNMSLDWMHVDCFHFQMVVVLAIM